MRSGLVLGSAACVWDDAAAALDRFKPDVVLAVNDIAARWAQRVDFMVTLHPEKLSMWLDGRAVLGLHAPGTVVAHQAHERVDLVEDYRWPAMTGSGSSGLFAVKVALDCAGCDRVVLAGIPMQMSQAHFFDAAPWRDRDSFLRGWHDAMPFIRDRVRSMSGWTRDVLGAPTPEWLAG